MANPTRISGHELEHSNAVQTAGLQPPQGDLIRVGSRRWFLQCGTAGLAGLSLGQLLQCGAKASEHSPAPRSVILIWLSGGPSHLDFWDPKPDAPTEIRGPFDAIATKVPGEPTGC